MSEPVMPWPANQIADQVEGAVNQAIVSLQFQDMVTQLRHTYSVASICWLRSPAMRAAWLQHCVTVVIRRRPCRHWKISGNILNKFLEKLAALKQGVQHNPVAQTGFASGDVELF